MSCLTFQICGTMNACRHYRCNLPQRDFYPPYFLILLQLVPCRFVQGRYLHNAHPHTPTHTHTWHNFYISCWQIFSDLFQHTKWHLLQLRKKKKNLACLCVYKKKCFYGVLLLYCLLTSCIMCSILTKPVVFKHTF